MWTCGERLCVSVCREFRVDRQTRQVKKRRRRHRTRHLMLSLFTSWCRWIITAALRGKEAHAAWNELTVSRLKSHAAGFRRNFGVPGAEAMSSCSRKSAAQMRTASSSMSLWPLPRCQSGSCASAASEWSFRPCESVHTRCEQAEDMHERKNSSECTRAHSSTARRHRPFRA